VTAQIDGRVKSIYGIYRKMYIQGRSFDEIYDISLQKARLLYPAQWYAAIDTCSAWG